MRFRAPKGHLFYLAGASEPLVQDALQREIFRGAVVYDVGSYVGFDAVVCARLVGGTGHVCAFEPVRESAEQLRANVARNGPQNVTVLEKAVGSTAGRPSIVGAGGSAAIADGGAIEVVALDDLDLPAPDLVKIDVEGHEVETLRGMRRTLTAHRPVVVVEIHGDRRAACESALTEMGFDLEWLDDGGMPHLLARPAAREHAA